jgi:hypothetical protein
MKFIYPMLLLFLASTAQSAIDESSVKTIDAAATYVVEPNIIVTKVCIDGQFFLISHISDGGTGITPSLRNGRPEKCDNAQYTRTADEDPQGARPRPRQTLPGRSVTPSFTLRF